MMYYCHKCGYMGNGKGKKRLRHRVKVCCGAMMQRLNKETTARIRETDERLKEK